MIETSVIILRKTLYSETSIIAATLSAEYGRLDFVFRGVRKFTSKKFPDIDLFREIQVQFRNTNSSLHNLYSSELVRTNDGIARFPENFINACEISAFVLRNSQPMSPAPMLHCVLKNAIERLAESKTDFPWISVVKLVFLSEHGLLPETHSIHSGMKSKGRELEKNQIISKIVNAGLGNCRFPAMSPKSWSATSSWIDKMLQYHDIK